MNARQKAKKYKKELELLKSQKHKYTIQRDSNVRMLRVSRQFDMEYISSMPPKMLVREMAKLMADSPIFTNALRLDNYYDELADSMHVKATIGIVELPRE